MNTTQGISPDRERIGGGEFALFAAIVTAAMAIRIWNVGWGLPDVFEEATPYAVARQFWGGPGGRFNFIPEFFHYPALSFYVQWFVQALQFAGGLATGQYGSFDAFRAAMANDPGSFMTGARLASVVFDAGTVGLTWYVARQHFGSAVAIGAALLAAFNPLQVQNAQSVNVDVILTFFLMLSLRASLSLTGHSGPRDFAIAGALIGLAASTKYTGALFLAVPAFAVGADFIRGTARTWRFALREVALTLLVPVCAAAVFALLNPGIVLDPSGFIRDVGYERLHMSYGHLGLDPEVGSVAFYLVITIGSMFGFLFLGGAIAGVAVSASSRNTGGIAIAAMAAIYIGLISTWEMHAARYLLPAIPLLAILCSAGCAGSMRWAAIKATEAGWAQRLRPVLVRALPVAALVSVIAIPAIGTARYILDSGRTDTRTKAREWIVENVQPGSIVVAGPFGIEVPAATATTVSIPFAATGAEALAPFYDVRWYEDFELMIASDYDLARYRREPDRFPAMLRFEDELHSHWRLLAEFNPGDGADSLRGPAIRLYAPDRSARVDSFGLDLLRALARVDNPELVARFAGNLSRALYTRGRMAKCHQLLNFGTEVAPADGGLAATRAFVEYKEGDTEEALRTIQAAEAAGGVNFELLTLKGNILVQSGDFSRAETALDAARELRPSEPLPYSLLIGLYSAKADTAALVRTLSDYLAAVPIGSEEATRIEAWLDTLKVAGVKEKSRR